MGGNREGLCHVGNPRAAMQRAAAASARFQRRKPGLPIEAFVQSTTTVPVTEMLREPALSVAQVLERQPRDGPQPSPFERSIAEIRANPDLSARAIAKRINVSHQTVIRAQAAL